MKLLIAGWIVLAVGIVFMVAGAKVESHRDAKFFLRVAQLFSLSAMVIFIVSLTIGGN